jgi:hypothetical protein
MRRLVASKEDKEQMVQRMQRIAEQLNKKIGKRRCVGCLFVFAYPSGHRIFICEQFFYMCELPDIAVIDKDIVAPLNILKSRVAHVGAVCDRMEAAERQVAACVLTMQSVERGQKEVAAQCKAIDAQLRSKAGMTDLCLKVDAAALDATLGELSHEISTELQVTIHDSGTCVRNGSVQFAKLCLRVRFPKPMHVCDMRVGST